MVYNFYIVTDVTTEVYPLNWLECAIVPEKERNRQFYRRKFQGSLTFGGKKLCSDFNLFYDIADPCEEIYFAIFKDTVLWWEGYFSTGMGSWDLDNKTFTVTPILIDDYTDWDERGDEYYNILDVVPEVTVLTKGVQYTHNRWVLDVVEFLAVKVFPGTAVASNFFTATTDYVTHLPSKLRYITIAQKSDIKNPLASNPSTEALLSFNELMDILRGMFNVYWTYASGVVTLEHVSAFSYTPGLDLRTQEMALKMNKYKYLTEEMPKYESWYPMEGFSPDFKKGNIFYLSKCVNQNPDTNEWQFNMRVTTEIEYIQDSVLAGDGGVIANDGFVMLANYLTGGNYHTYQMAGIYDSTVRYNTPLAWSYLLYYYHRHDRVLLQGYFNGILQDFISARKTKIQEISAIACTDFDPEDYITTELGETYFGGEKGYVRKATIKPYGEVNFELLYGPVDNADTGVTADAKNINVIVVGLDVYTYLSEPNIYDTYFSIWTNESTNPDDVCDEIMIPAGTMYQQDLLTQPNPITETSYNFSDASLTGWTATVDGITTYDTHVDGDCAAGSPPAPAVPDVPAITGHSQATTCGPIRVVWGAEANATYYVLQRNPNMGGSAAWETQYSGTALTYDDFNAGTQEGITFLYRVAAGNIAGISAWSAEHTVDDIMC